MSNSMARNPRPAGTPGPTRQQLDELDALLQRMLDLPVSPDGEAEEPEPEPARPARPGRPIPAPEPDLPPVRYYEPDVDLEDDDDDGPPPGYPPQTTLIGASRADLLPEPAPETLGPRLMRPVTPEPPLFEPPVPGGRHDLEEDTPVDPTEELARLRAQMQERAALPPTAHIPNPPSVEGDWVPLRSSWQPSAQTWKPLAERWQQAAEPEPAAWQPPVPSGPVVLTQTAAEPEPEPAPALPAPAPVPAAAPEPTAAAPAGPRYPWPAMPLVWFNAAFDVVLLPWCPRGRLLRGPAGRSFLGAVGILCLLAAAALAGAEWFGWTW